MFSSAIDERVRISIRDAQATRMRDGGFVECAQNTGTRKPGNENTANAFLLWRNYSTERLKFKKKTSRVITGNEMYRSAAADLRVRINSAVHNVSVTYPAVLKCIYFYFFMVKIKKMIYI